MSNIVRFPPPPARPRAEATSNLAIDAPQARALKQLADALKEKKFVRLSDRECLGRNWHKILKHLKHDRGLKSKEAVYRVLQKPTSTDNAQKKSQYFELPSKLVENAAAFEQRKQMLTQHGERWLKLAERAADLTGLGQHELLPALLKDTSLAPASAVPTQETPDPVASLLQLANAACTKIAALVDLKTYFADWDRGWVMYRSVDCAFLPTSANIEDGYYWPMRSDQYKLDSELVIRPFYGEMPLPSFAFARAFRFRFPAQLLVDDSADQAVVVEYVREFRLAIAVNALEDKIAPAIEIANTAIMTDASTGQQIPFHPTYDFPDARGFFESYREARDIPEEDDDSVFVPNLWVANGSDRLVGGWLAPSCSHDDMLSWEQALKTRDRGYPILNDELETHYVLLTPHTAMSLLKAPCQETRGLRSRPVLNGSAENALSILEAMLLEGTGDASFFHSLLSDAKTKIAAFRVAYDQVLTQVQDDHRRAMSDFSSP